MKKILDVISGLFAWIGAILLGLLMIRKTRNEESPSVLAKKALNMTDEEIEEKCNEKRKETVARIGACSARDITESYGGACDAIHEGIERFKRRID